MNHPYVKQIVVDDSHMMHDENAAVAIIGMHRSGTSMVSMLLNACGLNLGPPEALLQGDEHNRMGYYENEQFTYAIDDPLLTHLGGAWNSPPMLKEGWERDPAIKHFFDEAKALVSALSNSPVWGWKDPRATLLLPFWRSVVPYLRFVVCVRNPLDVAKSLYKRNGLSFDHAMLLWHHYMQAAIEGTKGSSRIFVFYEDFFSDATAQIRRLVDFCGLEEPADFRELESLIALELKHHASDDQELLNSEKMLAHSKLLYLGLRALCHDSLATPSPAVARVERISQSVSTYNELLHGLNDVSKVDQMRVEMEHKDRLLENHHKIICAMLSHQRAICDCFQRNVSSLGDSMEVKEQTIKQQNELLQQLTNERDGLDSALEKIDGLLGWRLMCSIYRLEDKLFCPGSLRRRIYDLAWRMLKIFPSKARQDFKPANNVLGAVRRTSYMLKASVAALFRFIETLMEPIVVGILMILSIPFAIILAILVSLSDCWAFVLREVKGGQRVLPDSSEEEISEPKLRRLDQPVSIIIPTWNGRELLEMSLPHLASALAAHVPGGEIIVMDNGSTDGTGDYLAKKYPDVRIIKFQSNKGFAVAANRGVIESRHPTVILLNNDMVVEKEFIAPLLRAFEDEPRAFGVSSQIYFLDQNKPRWETGKVHAKWDLGTLTLFHLYRWDDDLLYPVFFAGGGASAYDRNKFIALGGFDDSVYEPVYIEDADLGYRAWKRGWPSLFAPKSIVHHKHRSTSTRLWSEAVIQSFFVRHLAAFVWKNVSSYSLLARHLCGLVILPARVRRGFGLTSALLTFKGMVCQVPRVLTARIREKQRPSVLDDQTIMDVSRYRYAFRAYFTHRARREQGKRKRLLMVTAYSPYPPVHGGAVRMLSLIKRLRYLFDIDLITFADTPAELDTQSLAALKDLCRQVVVIKRDIASPNGILDPTQTSGFTSRKMAEEIEFLLDREDYDVIEINYTHMAHFLPPRVPGLLCSLVEHDVSFVSFGRQWPHLRGILPRLEICFDWMRLIRYEVKAVESVDLVIVMSENDKRTLENYAKVKSMHCIPNGVDCKDFSYMESGREPCSVLFVGFFRHEPNVQAVKYFYHEVLPAVRKSHPQLRFYIVGAYPPEPILLMQNLEGIEVTGRVDNIVPYYHRSTIFVAPILRGSGTRLKILEAMSSGCPVVSSSIGAEGLDTVHGEHLLIADTPAAMAQAIDQLLRERAFAITMARRARQFVVANYDWDAIAERLSNIYDQGGGQWRAS